MHRPGSSDDVALRHIVLFRIFDDVGDSLVDEAIDRLRALEVLPGIVSWRVERSLDTRKGRVVIEDATFVDTDSFEAFRDAPEHVEMARFMAQISDWWVGDYGEGDRHAAH